MRVYMAFCERATYPVADGQFYPEILVAADETTMGVNEEYYQEQIDKELENWGDEAGPVRHFIVDIPDAAIERAFKAVEVKDATVEEVRR